jgi:type I restriction enzyme R subunit
MAYFNESSLEMAIMELFKTERYIYQNGNTILKDDTEVLLRDDLRQYLNDRYKTAGITDIETERAINQLTANAGVSMYEQNAITLRLMVEGFSVKREDSGLPDLFIEPIDFTGARNIVKIVNQLKMRGRCDRIPDGIVYVNGLPLVVLEFKSAIKENTTIMDAYKQLTIRYRRDIPELFRYNAFVVISDGVNNKYGSLFTPYEYFYAWRKVEADDDTADGIDALDTLVKGLFRKDRLLAVVKDFIYMPDNSSKEEKIICRYPQYFAATKLLASIKSHSRIMLHGDGKGGTYFGGTGCGKSYAMLFLTRMLMRDKAFGNPTILLITDRTDLDTQLSKQFKNAKRFIGDDCVMCIENRAHLGEMLRGRKSGGVFLTTIQKFTEELQLLSDRSNIICISDEAHRTQVNMDEKIRVDENGVKRNYGFARYLHDSLPNATYVGFTGTPIDATLEVFGPIVDAYTMKQSVEDKITNRIVYEGRAAKVLLDNGKLQEIEDYYDKCADDGANEYQIEESKKAVSRMEVIIGDSQRLEAVAKDLVAHYERRVEEGSTVVGKAMIVCMSRKIAFRLYKYISELRPEWITLPADGTDETEGENRGEKMAADYIPEYGASVMPIEKMKMIMTYNKDDDAELYEILDRDRNRTDLDTQFKNPHSNFKIAIVVDMWITGFDVPCLDTMYIDRPLQKHTLVQTISRVNRLYEGKTKGLVVDYFGIRRKMDDALAKYNQGDGFGSSVEEQEQSVVLVKDELDILRKLFYPFDYGTFTSGTPLQQLDCLNKGPSI